MPSSRRITMYNPHILTDSEQGTPPGIQAMREQMYEVQKALIDHRIDPKHRNAFAENEWQYLNEMPFNERFSANPRPAPGSNRNILHAAEIFDPGFVPQSMPYQLPPRRDPPRRVCRYYDSRGEEIFPEGVNPWKIEESHQRNDSGYVSNAWEIAADDEEDDGIDAWCDDVLAQAQLVEPNKHMLRPDVACFQPGVKYGSKGRDDDPIPNIAGIVDCFDERGGQFAVTADELEVLDYAGFTSSLGRLPRGTLSEGADVGYFVEGWERELIRHGDARCTKSEYDIESLPSQDSVSSFDGAASGIWSECAYVGYFLMETNSHRKGTLALTNYELEALDYEGERHKLECGARDARSEGAMSEDNKENYESRFEPGSKARWSL